MELHHDLVLLQILVDGSTGTLPVTIIVDNQHSTWREFGKEHLQFMLGRCIPVRV
jgi:hypothetical protein